MKAPSNLTPTEALDAATVSVVGPFGRNAQEVEQGLRRAELVREQLRWLGFDVLPLPTAEGAKP